MPLYLALIAGAVALDQWSKYWLVRHYALGESTPVIDGVFHITRFHNTGAAFSSFLDRQEFLIVLTGLLILAGLIFLWVQRRKMERFPLGVLALILGGGIGNLLDRIFRGYVVDFLDFGSFPIFNVADIFVTGGCILLLLYLLFSGREKKGRKDA